MELDDDGTGSAAGFSPGAQPFGTLTNIGIFVPSFAGYVMSFAGTNVERSTSGAEGSTHCVSVFFSQSQT